MKKEPFDPVICWICDYWWVIVIILVLLLVAYFTYPYWAVLFV
jgi:hypothetical protein